MRPKRAKPRSSEFSAKRLADAMMTRPSRSPHASTLIDGARARAVDGLGAPLWQKASFARVCRACLIQSCSWRLPQLASGRGALARLGSLHPSRRAGSTQSRARSSLVGTRCCFHGVPEVLFASAESWAAHTRGCRACACLRSAGLSFRRCRLQSLLCRCTHATSVEWCEPRLAACNGAASTDAALLPAETRLKLSIRLCRSALQRRTRCAYP